MTGGSNIKCLVVTTIDRTIMSFLIPHIQLLRGLGYDVTIATSITDYKRLVVELPDVQIVDIPFSRSVKSLSNLKAYKGLRKLLKNENYQLIHVHTPIAAFLTRMVTSRDQNVIYTAHGFHFHENGSKWSNQLYYLAEKMAASKTSKLVAINEDDYKQALTMLSSEKVHYIKGVGIDSRKYNPANYTDSIKKNIKASLGINENINVITYIAEFNKNKRQLDVIKMAEKLRDNNYPNFVVLLIGQGPLQQEIIKEITSRNLQGYIRCLGYRLDICDLLSITDIGLQVSLREGLPRAVMEMMAMEIPVIGTNIRGTRDLVHSGENGWLVSIKNPDELFQACKTLLNDDYLRKKIGVKGRQIIIQEYDLQKILRDMEKIYELNPNQSLNVDLQSG